MKAAISSFAFRYSIEVRDLDYMVDKERVEEAMKLSIINVPEETANPFFIGMKINFLQD